MYIGAAQDCNILDANIAIEPLSLDTWNSSARDINLSSCDPMEHPTTHPKKYLLIGEIFATFITLKFVVDNVVKRFAVKSKAPF